MKSDIYVAKASFITGDGERVTKGVTRVRAGHPILKGREHQFELLTVHYDLEQATAAPGTPRRGRPPKPQTAPAAGDKE